MKLAKIGEWAFFIGVILAIIVGFVVGSPSTAGYPAAVAATLVILGILVGLLNISEKETTAYLVAAITMLTASTAAKFSIILFGNYLTAILENISLFVAPGAVIVALKAIITLSKDK